VVDGAVRQVAADELDQALVGADQRPGHHSGAQVALAMALATAVAMFCYLAAIFGLR
jgi:hypothetical protein